MERRRQHSARRDAWSRRRRRPRRWVEEGAVHRGGCKKSACTSMTSAREPSRLRDWRNAPLQRASAVTRRRARPRRDSDAVPHRAKVAGGRTPAPSTTRGGGPTLADPSPVAEPEGSRYIAPHPLADLREDPYRQDRDARGGAVRLDRDPGQGVGIPKVVDSIDLGSPSRRRSTKTSSASSSRGSSSRTAARSPTTTSRRSRRSTSCCEVEPARNVKAKMDKIFSQDPHGQDDHTRRRAERHDRQREAEDPGQGGHPARPAAPHLRRQAARGRPHALGLQHPEGVDAPPRALIERSSTVFLSAQRVETPRPDGISLTLCFAPTKSANTWSSPRRASRAPSTGRRPTASAQRRPSALKTMSPTPPHAPYGRLAR